MDRSRKRTYPISGKQVTVDADVQTTATVIDGKSALLSQNHITETSQTTKTYLSIYWIRPVDGQPGSYELGSQGTDQPSSSGVLGSDGIFRVEQDLGGGSTPYVVRSQTVFSPDQSVYSDTFTVGTEIQSQTRIEYQRTTP